MTVEEASGLLTQEIELTPQAQKALDFLVHNAKKNLAATSKQVWLIDKKLEESNSTLGDFALANNIEAKTTKQLTKEEANVIIKLLLAD